MQSNNPMLVTFFELYKLSKVSINYKLYAPDICFNDSCPICLEKFTPFTGDISALTFYGSDTTVTSVFNTNIKYALYFIPAKTFNGKKTDFVFKLGNHGLGYYYDGKNKFTCNGKIINLDIISDLPCKHAFHYQCLEPWIKKNLNCPLCKKTLPIEKKAKTSFQDNYEILQTDFIFF